MVFCSGVPVPSDIVPVVTVAKEIQVDDQ